jgi:hypothetical protein
MWTNEICARYDRSKLRYPSDLTDDGWALIKTLIPRAKRGSCKRRGGNAIDFGQTIRPCGVDEVACRGRE